LYPTLMKREIRMKSENRTRSLNSRPDVREF
jgi:hypothetical protein